MTVDYYLTICMEVSLSYSFSLGSLWEPLHIPPRHCGLQAKGGRQVVQSRLSKNRYSNQDVLHHLQSHNTHCSGWRRPLRANLSAILHIFSNSKIEKNIYCIWGAQRFPKARLWFKGYCTSKECPASRFEENERHHSPHISTCTYI
jgi:hypothetical protein